MSPSENIEVVLRGYADYNRGAIDASFEASHPDCEWVSPDFPGGSCHGHDEMRAFFTSVAEMFDGWQVIPYEVHAAGELVVALVVSGGRGRQSGIEVHRNVAQVWSMRDGRATRIETITEFAEALALLESSDGPREHWRAERLAPNVAAVVARRG